MHLAPLVWLLSRLALASIVVLLLYPLVFLGPAVVCTSSIVQSLFGRRLGSVPSATIGRRLNHGLGISCMVW